VKVSLAVTHKEGFVAGIQAYPDNPYDGHTLDGQLDQVERLTGRVPTHTYVDRGDKGHGIPEERSRVLISRTRKLGYTLKRHLRRRAAVEPEIGHMKADGLLGRKFLKGMQGDAINAILCGAGHNMRTILARLRALLYLFAGEAREALQALFRHLEVLRLHQAASGGLGIAGRVSQDRLAISVVRIQPCTPGWKPSASLPGRSRWMWPCL
jgi:IS5 family transposase